MCLEAEKVSVNRNPQNKQIQTWVSERVTEDGERETVSLQVTLVSMMQRRAGEQWSDREVEVGVLIREEQTPLSPCPPDTHAWEDRGPLPASTNTDTHARTRSLARSEQTCQLVHKHPPTHAISGIARAYR